MKKMMTTPRLMMIAALTSLVGCSKDLVQPSQPAASAALHGTIQLADQYGKLVSDKSGIQVQLQGQGQQHTLHTTPDGQYRFAAMPAGQYQLQVSKAGYAPHQATISVGQQPAQLVSTIVLGMPAAHQVIASQPQLGVQQLSLYIDAQPAPAKGKPAGYRAFVSTKAQPGPANHVYTKVASTEVSGQYDIISRSELQALGFSKGQTVYVAVYADVLNVTPVAAPGFTSFPAMQQHGAQYFSLTY